jgi:hypothetical protein
LGLIYNSYLYHSIMADDEWAGHTPSGSPDILNEYIVAAEKVESLKADGKDSLEKKKNAEEVVQDAEEALNAAKANLKKAEKQRMDTLSDLEGASSVVDEKVDEFTRARESRDALAMNYHSSIPNYEGGLSKGPRLPSPVGGPGNGTITIRALGDVHGWGPGLLAFLLQNELATVSLNGERCESDEKLSSQFPSPFEYDSDRIFIEGPWFDRSPFITPGDIGTIFRGQVKSIDITPSDKLITDSIFIQIGDLIDRGDYSELALESMRQLIQKSPGSTLSLVGNHEGFLIDGSIRGWLKNERRHEFDRSRRNIAGTIRLDHKRAGSQLGGGKFLESVFSSYSAHYAHLLLTQEYSLRMSLDDSSRDRLRSMTQPSLDLAGIDDRELERIATSNDWSVIERSLEWLDTVRKEESPMTLAGALCMFSVGHSLYLHAESNALLKVTDEDWVEFGRPFKTQNGAEYRMLFYATADKTGSEKVKSRHHPLLWSRSKTRWLLNEASTDLKEAADGLVKRLPWITQIYHGHTPIKKVHSLDVDTANLRVTNLDWSWTPPYFSDAGDKNPYSVKRKVQYDTMESLGRTPLAHTGVRSLHHDVTISPFIEGVSRGYIRIGRNNICNFKRSFGQGKEIHARVVSPDEIVGYSRSGQINHGAEFKGELGSEMVLAINRRIEKGGFLKALGFVSHYYKPIAIIHDYDDLDWVDQMSSMIYDQQLKDEDKREEEIRKAQKKEQERKAAEKKARKKERERKAAEKKERERKAAEKETGEKEISDDEKKNGD